MSVMKNQPYLVCKRCGQTYTFSLSTTSSDIEGDQLFQFMDGVLKDGLCVGCQQKKSWYIQQGRISDWEAGRP